MCLLNLSNEIPYGGWRAPHVHGVAENHHIFRNKTEIEWGTNDFSIISIAFWSSQWPAYEQRSWVPETVWFRKKLREKYRKRWTLVIGGLYICSAKIWIHSFSGMCWDNCSNDWKCVITMNATKKLEKVHLGTKTNHR